MDTPERSRDADRPQHQPPTGTPLSRSRFEDSPVFNFLNNLSPIRPVRSVQITQTFQSLGFASIPSVFTSPHTNKESETLFLIRHQPVDLPSAEVFTCDGTEKNQYAGLPSSSKQSEEVADDENRERVVHCSLNKANVDPPDESHAPQNCLFRSLQYDCGSPNHNTTPSHDIKINVQSNNCSSLTGDIVNEGYEERSNDPESQEMHHEGTREDVSGCNWENLISNNTEDLLVFGSSDGPAEPSLFDNLEDDSNHNDTSLRLSSSSLDDAWKNQTDSSRDPCQENVSRDTPDRCSVLISNENENDHSLQFLSLSHNHSGGHGREVNVDDRASHCFPSKSKVDCDIQHGMLRRCLVFEMGRTVKKNSDNSNLPYHEKHSSGDASSASIKTLSDTSTSFLPSIGLHLNSLASSSKERFVAKEDVISGTQLIFVPQSSLPSGRISHRTGPPEHDQVTLDHSLQNILAMADTPITSKKELEHASPKKKQKESGNGGESCKRCNCKKSKCLKLYCECFAAGIYCVEPCSCQGCLNKPIHEDVVVATRKQIESRNPLAFAPKVIKTSDRLAEIGEDANKTPASARHKRGCNCKKSNCLKKYCECYQGGAGCSMSCRCEGCKNTFGTKDGKMPLAIIATEREDDETGACRVDDENTRLDGTQKGIQNTKHQFMERYPITPAIQIIRQPSFSSSGKPPISPKLLSTIRCSRLSASMSIGDNGPLEPKLEKSCQVNPEVGTPEILGGDKSPVSGIKIVSPSRKRVSPPHNHETGISPRHKGCRKLILKSIPSFPSLTSSSANETAANAPRSPLNLSKLN